MMEIKFRYWRKYENKMYDKAYVEEHRKFAFMSELLEAAQERYIFQQFIGLKDGDNKDIYDGDLVRITNNNRFFNENINCISKVKVIEGHPYVWLDPVISGEKKHYGARLLMKGEAKHLRDHVIATSDVEIIGNVFKNPELLGGE